MNNTNYHIYKLFQFLFVTMLFLGCSAEQIPEITEGIDACAECNMTIDQVSQACGYFEQGGFVTFDSPGCLLNHHSANGYLSPESPAGIYMADYVSGKLVSADSIWFLLTDHIPTVMNGRVLCFAIEKAAEANKRYADEIITDWRGYWTQRAKPHVLIRLDVTDSEALPGTFMVEKGNLIEWEAVPRELKEPVSLRIQGYDEIGIVELVPGGPIVSFRMYATLPGAGFPIVNTNNGLVMGMVKVSGAHTDDEEQL